MPSPSRRSVLASIGFGAVGAGGYAAMRHATQWNPDPEDCAIDDNERSADAPVEGSFPHPRADHRMSGQVSGSSGTATEAAIGDEHWRTDIGPGPDSLGVGNLAAPVVSGEYCYVSDRRLYALNRSDGTLAWCADPGPRELTSPTVADGTVFVASRFVIGRAWRGVTAFDAETGERLWRAPSRQLLKPTVGLPETAPTVHDGSVYIGGATETRAVTALDADTGSVEWQTDVAEPGSRTASAAVGDGGVFALVGSRIARLDATSGDVTWETAAGEAYCPPVLADGAVYAPHDDRSVARWDATDGVHRWTFERFRERPRSLAVADGTLYAVTERKIIALDARERTVSWERTGADLVEVGVSDDGVATLRHCTVSDDCVYLSIGSSLAVLDRSDGSLVATVAFSEESEGDAVYAGRPGVPAVAGGVAYCLTETGDLYALDV
ncbi:PQQ-binding-like beta-propeller repeat protein [Halosimplex pelagicum]|uniref:PQQ-like beta-propeller repeat protein n=1 Tax=Halosimplex pelagicum TaxID=869886 RepID=A0A7D5TE40_9EURY|nr:PQQ-binding-like beta-propeller repeat protein [Halosimplex pelagicum]QLH83575.1 PQQ-like beta-propeller repeat protein [Halosimplex pelagicum]